MKCNILLPLFILLLTGSIFPQEPDKGSGIIKPQATIQRIVETRQGHKSCWGVLIQLNKMSFNKTIKANELSIIEQKHGHELKNIMVWSRSEENTSELQSLRH